MSWNINNESSYIKKLLQLPVIKDLMSDGNVMCIRVDGSRAAGLEDNHSDYDITIMLNKEADTEYKYCKLRYQIENKKTHFYIQGKDWFKHQYEDPTSHLICIIGGLLHYINFTKETILYLNPKFAQKTTEILVHKDLFYKQGLYELISVKDYLLEKYFQNFWIRKSLYSFFQVCGELMNEQVDLNLLYKYKSLFYDLSIGQEQLQLFKKCLSKIEIDIKDNSKALQEILNG